MFGMPLLDHKSGISPSDFVSRGLVPGPLNARDCFGFVVDQDTASMNVMSAQPLPIIGADGRWNLRKKIDKSTDLT
jgi:hypothetical protein